MTSRRRLARDPTRSTRRPASLTGVSAHNRVKGCDLPALVAGGVYAGPFERLQELEDEGEFDAIVANAPPGDGYWALPEEWGVASNMLAGGGITLLNDVPAL